MISIKVDEVIQKEKLLDGTGSMCRARLTQHASVFVIGKNLSRKSIIIQETDPRTLEKSYTHRGVPIELFRNETVASIERFFALSETLCEIEKAKEPVIVPPANMLRSLELYIIKRIEPTRSPDALSVFDCDVCINEDCDKFYICNWRLDLINFINERKVEVDRERRACQTAARLAKKKLKGETCKTNK